MSLWCDEKGDRPLTELGREELIAALEETGAELARLRKDIREGRLVATLLGRSAMEDEIGRARVWNRIMRRVLDRIGE